MPQRQSNSDVFSPELIRILKIFGVISVGFVLVLSFFNTKRANNSGGDSSFRMSSSSRLYFLNVRAINYDRETRADAAMLLFRHGKREISDSGPLLDLVILLNSIKDEAYIYLEPTRVDWPLEIRATINKEQQVLHLENGNNSELLAYVMRLQSWIGKDADFEIKIDSGWFPIWSKPGEKDAIKTTIEDYFRLVNG
ncbi:hypothetical protein LZF95_11705 [Algoriphagus sp. AGSA1]|uniref:hypothetical protein n=1 Tax=Algoriphagus sp. AGSA1 TaxID=2907213 RepID=UPI001F1F672D|nr:hypothetical protein [Algoriphagus sp. AGSA1]MCE7055341.1 hypothetical protein [Algoriphagus sp. AGSA1]